MQYMLDYIYDTMFLVTPLLYLCVRQEAGAHSQSCYRWKVQLMITSGLPQVSGFSPWQVPEHVDNSAYQKHSSDSVPFLKIYAVFQEYFLNGKLLAFQNSTKKYVNFLAGDISLLKVSL